MIAFVKTAALTAGILSIALAASPTIANIYKHVDENGNVSFSDKPIQGAEKVKIHNTRSSSNSNFAGESEEAADAESSEVIESPDYKSLAILTPREGKVVEENASAVQIILLPTPSLGDNDELVIAIDGKEISKGRDVNLSVRNLESGNHTVTSRIQNKAGKVIIESDSVNFSIGE